jgi:WD40 repeat protein
VTFSPDDRYLISGGGDKIIVWDPRTGKKLQVLKNLEQDVSSVAFSHDGNRLASASGNDNKVVLWDIALWDPQTSKPLRVFNGHHDWVSSVAFSPDDELLASGGYDGNIILWDDANLAAAQEHACRIANRNLSPKEWAEHIGREVPYSRTCPHITSGEDDLTK